MEITSPAPKPPSCRWFSTDTTDSADNSRQSTDGRQSIGQSLIFEPPKKINRMYYRCQDRYDLNLIQDMFDDEMMECYGICLISGKHLIVYTISVHANGQTYDALILKKREIRLPNKHNKGGQSSVRFGRIADIVRSKYCEEFAQDIVQAYMTENHTRCIIKKLVVAGFGSMPSDVVETSIFKQHLASYLFKVVAVNDFDDTTAVSLLAGLMVEFQQDDCLKINQTIDQLVQTNSDLMIFGEVECVELLESNKLKTLYVGADIVDAGMRDRLSAITRLVPNNETKIIVTSASKIMIYGGWIGVRSYVDQPYVDQLYDGEN